MSERTAAIVIDNFLTDDQWSFVQSNLGNYLNTSEFVENRDEPYVTCIGWIKDKLSSFDFFNEHWNTCLLYTSPSPRDAIPSRMPSSA